MRPVVGALCTKVIVSTGRHMQSRIAFAVCENPCPTTYVFSTIMMYFRARHSALKITESLPSAF